MSELPRDPSSDVAPQTLPKWAPRLIEAWLAATLVVFFVVRILGSHAVQGLLHKAGR